MESRPPPGRANQAKSIAHRQEIFPVYVHFRRRLIANMQKQTQSGVGCDGIMLCRVISALHIWIISRRDQESVS